ncbi:MAG: DUF4405 domain-containing protein [Treponema sp.]
MIKKSQVRILIDIMMTVFSLILMGGNYFCTWDGVHEILGVALFVLWAFHIMLNRYWYSSLFKGTYRAFRIMQVFVNSLILICAILLMISGIMLSNHVFAFLNISFGANFARVAHLLASHWYFIGMSLHIGLHVEMMTKRMQKSRTSEKRGNLFISIISRLFIITISAYGAYAFITHGLWKYLFLQEQFFFLDIEKGYILFFIDYLAIIILFGAISHYLGKLLKK